MDEKELEKFRREKLPMYVSIVNGLQHAQDKYELMNAKRNLLTKLKQLDKRYNIDRAVLDEVYKENVEATLAELEIVNNKLENINKL